MDKKSLFLVLLFPLILSNFGCATMGLITPVPSENQKAIFKDGNKSIISMKENTVIVAPLSEKFSSDQREEFLVMVENGSSQEFNFSTDNIFAKSTEPVTSQDIYLKVFSYDDLVKEEKDREVWASIGAAIQGASDSIKAQNAGYSNTYGNYSGNNGYGSYTSSTYNYTEAQAAQRQAQEDSDVRFSRIEAEEQANLRDLSKTILKKETIFPNAWYGGIVVVQMPSVTETTGKFTMTIMINKESHVFNFTYSRIND